MHGVPKELNLSHLIGADVQRIDLSKWILHFRFGDPANTTIAVEGEWVLRAPSGRVLDRQAEPASRDCYRLHHLLLREVTDVRVNAPKSFTLVFAEGYELEVADDSAKYESFSIHPPGIYI